MHLVMFDIDGTLIESYDIDEQCFLAAIDEVLGIQIDSRWERYPHVTDAGILDEILSQPSFLPDRAVLEAQIKAWKKQRTAVTKELKAKAAVLPDELNTGVDALDNAQAAELLLTILPLT